MMKRRQRSAALSLIFLAVVFIVGAGLGRSMSRAIPIKDHRSFNATIAPTLKFRPLQSTAPATLARIEPSTRGFIQPLLPVNTMTLLNRKDSMINLSEKKRLTCDPPPMEKESSSNYEFLQVFGDMLREKFENLPWWLDEGGLIGSSRAGAMTNADDDFDFFMLLPNQHAPCNSNSLTCSPEEFEAYIFSFLMVFWNAGMCINKFYPDSKRFRSRGRLMYSFQLHRRNDVDPEHCFREDKPFAHMHLGIFNEKGQIQTNIWAKHTTHPIDSIPLEVVLPVKRCRVGTQDAPCPNNVTEYLTIRNRGEYRKKSSDGSCLLVKQRWGRNRKIEQVKKTERLRDCGYNGLFELIEPYKLSNFSTC
jgi:hypothetical protein